MYTVKLNKYGHVVYMFSKSVSVCIRVLTDFIVTIDVIKMVPVVSLFSTEH